MAMFGKKKAQKNNSLDHENQKELGKPATAKGRTLLMLSLLLAALSIAVLTVGVALLQHRVHKRRSLLLDLTSTVNSYRDTLQSAHYTPYVGAAHRQWQFLWWIIAAATFVWLMTAALALKAVRAVQWHPALVGLHIYILVLCTFAIDSFLYINHFNIARDIFGKKRVAVTLAGLFGLAVAEGLAVLALGMLPSKHHLDARNVQNSGVVERVVEKRIPLPVPAPRESHHEQYESQLPDRQHTPTFTNNPAQPVRVHQGGTQVTDVHPNNSEPVRVHMGGTQNVVGNTEPGANRY